MAKGRDGGVLQPASVLSVGRQSEDVVDNVYASIERAGIWIPYGEVYQHYISIKTRLINRLKAKKNAMSVRRSLPPQGRDELLTPFQEPFQLRIPCNCCVFRFQTVVWNFSFSIFEKWFPKAFFFTSK